MAWKESNLYATSATSMLLYRRAANNPCAVFSFVFFYGFGQPRVAGCRSGRYRLFDRARHSRSALAQFEPQFLALYGRDAAQLYERGGCDAALPYMKRENPFGERENSSMLTDRSGHNVCGPEPPVHLANLARSAGAASVEKSIRRRQSRSLLHLLKHQAARRMFSCSRCPMDVRPFGTYRSKPGCFARWRLWSQPE